MKPGFCMLFLGTLSACSSATTTALEDAANGGSEGCLGCDAPSGVQTGDSGDDGPGDCAPREEVVSDGAAVQAGFERATNELFAPALTPAEGSLRFADGEEVALSFSFSVDARSLRATYWEPQRAGVTCRAPSIIARVVLSVDASDALAGTASPELSAYADGLEADGTPAPLDDFETTLSQPFEPNAPATSLRLPLRFTAEDGWRGEWLWLRELGRDSAGAAFEERTELLGTVEAR